METRRIGERRGRRGADVVHRDQRDFGPGLDGRDQPAVGEQERRRQEVLHEAPRLEQRPVRETGVADPVLDRGLRFEVVLHGRPAAFGPAGRGVRPIVLDHEPGRHGTGDVAQLQLPCVTVDMPVHRELRSRNLQRGPARLA